MHNNNDDDDNDDYDDSGDDNNHDDDNNHYHDDDNLKAGLISYSTNVLHPDTIHSSYPHCTGTKTDKLEQT